MKIKNNSGNTLAHSQALVEGRVEPGTHCLRMHENLWNRASKYVHKQTQSHGEK